jgi:aminopeptidase N
MHLTVPGGMVGASNGTLTSTVTNQDGTSTYTWHESYPIANYLISANVTNYANFSDSYTSLDGTTQMPLEYYVYPENESDARALFVRIPDMITYFAGIGGEYPFLAEKYGMVAFPWGGGMEHQTLTSMGDMYTWGTDDEDGIYAHELSHQWWGDDVTCATWDDIWLNEGFATYFEILWLCRHYGVPESEMVTYYDDGLYNGALGGSVHIKNANKPFDDQGAVYDKGGWVLHMLKRVMSEDLFNGALRDYRAAHAGANASTADLRAACEGRYGSDLAWFFDQWVFTPKRPIYSVSFNQTGTSVTVTVAQKQKHKVVNRTTLQDVYIMPVDLTLQYADGSSETFTVHNDQRTQSFTFTAAKNVTHVGFDEDNWILKVVH